MFTAGELRQLVTIKTVNESGDGHDGLVDSDVTIASRVPAKIRPLQGRDLERARQIDPRISHEVTLRYWSRYLSDLKGGRATLVYHDVNDRAFEIVGPPIDVDEAHVQLTLLCREAA